MVVEVRRWLLRFVDGRCDLLLVAEVRRWSLRFVDGC